MKKWIVLGLGLCWAGRVGAAETSVEFVFSSTDVALAPAGTYTAVDLAEGTHVVDELGAPSIPAKFVNVLLPAGAQNVKISASGDGTLLAEGLRPYPAQPRSPKSKPRPAFVPANARYASAAAWPAEVATYQGDHDMQGYRFVSVRVNPLAYVGAEKKLYLRRKIAVTATYDVAATRAVSSKQKSAFEPLVNSLVVNPADASAYAPATRAVEPKATVDYLIITSAALSNAFQQIADYRTSTAGGSYATRVLTTNLIAAGYSGTDMPAKIRACISNSVSTLGTTMVLLGGDDTVVPVRYTSVAVVSGDTYETNMPTDLYYSGLNGSWNSDGDAIYGETNDAVDMAWDVVVARLPVRTVAQTTNYLTKVKTYEAGAPVTNKIILGGPYAWNSYTLNNRPSDDVTGDGHAGFRATTPYNHTTVCDSEMWLRRLYRDGISNYWKATVGLMCDTITSWDTTTNCGSWAQSQANTKTAFNKNWTHLMFSGHGAPQEWGLETGSFYDTDASSMTGQTAFVYTDACLTGHFDKNSNTIDGYSYTTEPCLGEGFLRNANTLGGAVAYMGCARFGWGEPDASPASNTSDGGPSTVYAYKFYKRMYETAGRTLGTAFAMHKADMASLCADNEAERWIQFGLNLLGDPALKMPTGTAPTSAPVFDALGTQNATANVEMSFTVSASGNPPPVLALKSTTASSGYSFTASSGVLLYTPPEGDAGTTKTFTFTASNSVGAATQTVSVAVAAGPPAAPASIWASVTNSVAFTAAWSTVSSATGYRLDVALDSGFSGGGSADVLLNEGFVNGTTAPDGWTFTAIGKTYTTAGNYGTAAPSLQMDATGDAVQTPALAGPTNLSFWIKGQTTDSSSALLVESAAGGTWSTVANLTASLPTTGTTYSYPLSTAVTNLRFTYTKSKGNLAFDDVVVQGTGAASSGFVPGYSNRTVSGTSQSVTGLTENTTYYFRASAVNAAGTGTYSAVASVVTKTAGGTPPTVLFGADRVVGEEGGASVSLPVVLSAAAAATVQVAIAGTALPGGTDFVCATTTLVFTAASATSNLVFTIADDALPEGPETARLTLNPVSGATLGTTTQAVLVVRDNDAFSILAANLTSGTTTVNDVTTYDEAGGRILEALQPDVVLIQEWVLKPGVTRRAFVDEYFGTNYSFYVEPQGGYYPAPNGIISRWPIVASNEWASPYSSDTRDFPWAYVDLPGPRDLHAVSVHLKATGDVPADDLAIRIDQAQALTNYVAQSGWSANDYLVIGGDFNLNSRSEETLTILKNVVSDDKQPADQQATPNKNTNRGRDKPYDLVLPNALLDVRHANFTCSGYTFANGMVFDTRLTWSSGLPPPALAADSDAVNMQHMAVMKVFAFEPEETLPAAPASLWASATNATGFTAAWSSVSGASSYRFDVSTSMSFSGGGGGGSVYAVDFEDGTKGSYAAGDVALNGISWKLNEAVIGSTAGSDRFNGAKSARVRSNETANAGILAMNADTNMGLSSITLLHAMYGTDAATAGRVDYSVDSGSSWTSAGTFSVASTNLTLFESTNLNVSGSVRIRVVKTAGTTARYNIDDIRLYPFGGSAPAYVPGFSNLTVAGTSQLVTGLTAGVTYYFRVCAVNGTGTGTYSSVTNVTTPAKDNQTITFPTIAAQITTNTVALAATASSGLAVSYAVASGPATLAGNSLTFTAAGTVSIVASQAGNASWNPAPNVTNTFSVTKAAATVTLASLTQTYNGTARAATATTAPAGLTVVLTYNGAAAAPTNAGSYAVTGAVNSAMYAGSAAGTLNVGKVGLTVTADAKCKPCGAANPPLTLRYSGFVAGETSAVLTAAPTAATTVNAATLPGVYSGAITVSGGAAVNYAFAYVDADFTVTEAIASLAATNNDVKVTFGPVTNGAYELLYRASLTGGVWTVVDSLVASSTSASATLTHAGGGAQNLGYYRIDGRAGASAQTWGFVKAAKPGNAKLTMVGMPFVTSNQTLNSLMDPLQFSGHHLSPGSADQLMIWDAGTQGYLNLALYDVRSFGSQYAYLTGWKAYTNFTSQAPYVNPVLPAGAAVWIRGSTADDRKVAIAGEVVAARAVTNEIVQGLQLVANPFSETVGLSNLNIQAHATGHYLSPGSADQIMVWDAGTQGYVNLALYDVASYYGSQYAYLTGWKAYTNFTSGAPYVSPTLPPGQGFWYKAVSNDFEWVETNKYLGALE